MAEPKKRTSKGRRDRRRAHHKVTSSQSMTCKKCGAQVRPHTICQKCNTYYK